MRGFYFIEYGDVPPLVAAALPLIAYFWPRPETDEEIDLRCGGWVTSSLRGHAVSEAISALELDEEIARDSGATTEQARAETLLFLSAEMPASHRETVRDRSSEAASATHSAPEIADRWRSEVEVDRTDLETSWVQVTMLWISRNVPHFP